MQRQRPLVVVCLAGLLIGGITVERGSATTVIPIADHDLQDRADAIVHGVVISSWVEESAAGQPITVSVIAPIETVKGGSPATSCSGNSGEAPGWPVSEYLGQPAFSRGDQVVVFAVERPDGDHQTAELLMGKFDVQLRRDRHRLRGALAGWGVFERQRTRLAIGPGHGDRSTRALGFPLRAARIPGPAAHVHRGPAGRAPEHRRRRGGRGRRALEQRRDGRVDAGGSTNNTGGGLIEAAPAATTWNEEPNSTINYTIGSGSPNVMYLDALSSPCGWTRALSAAGSSGAAGHGEGGRMSGEVSRSTRSPGAPLAAVVLQLQRLGLHHDPGGSHP